MNFVLFNENDFNNKPKKLSSLIICFNCLTLDFKILFISLQVSITMRPIIRSEIALRNFKSEKELPVTRKRNIIDRRCFEEMTSHISV